MAELPQPVAPRIAALAEAFDLTPFERVVLALALLPEIDERVATPTVATALERGCADAEERLAARAAFQHPAPLARWMLIADDEASSLLAQRLRLHRRVIDFLLGSDTLDTALRAPAPVARWLAPREETELAWSDEPRAQRELLRTPPPGDADWLVLISGAQGSGRKTFAEAVCRARVVPLLLCDVALLTPPQVMSLFREVRLYGAALCLDGWPPSADVARLIAHELAQWAGLVFLTSSESLRAIDRPRRPCLDVELRVPDAATRRELWLRQGAGEETAARLAGLFRFGPGQIEDAFAAARTHDEPALIAACQAIASRHLVSFAVKVPVRRTWESLVLPPALLDQLRELADHVSFRTRVYDDWGFHATAGARAGLVALFTGPSGTGKTLSAEVIAGALGLELYRIDLASLISKYIGETEKNLARVFEDGERCGGILFFDEADAVFGKRTEVRDAHDRYANIETSYLLQRIEEYPGVVILASNMGRNIDSAFQRRMNFVLEFPFPDADHRGRIWRTVFPSAAPLAGEVDFDYLAQNFQLSGGHIRNVALAAAFRAAGNGGRIGMEHLVLSLKREYQKMGRVCERSEFGAYYDLVR